MERLQRGFRLLGASWEVLKADRELMLLPLVSFLATGLVLLTFIVGGLPLGNPLEGGFTGGQYVLLGIFYFVAYFISIFFNAAVVGAATIRLDGGDPTVRDGLRIAYSKIGKIVAWASLAATVGLILRAIEERVGFLGRIVIVIIGAAWSAVTFFVVPVLLYEPLSVGESVKRSASIFKQRWGEQFTGNVSIGAALVLIMIPVALVIGLIAVIQPAVAIVLGVLAFGLLMAAGSAMTGIFNAALYRYAVSGQAAGPFGEQDLKGAFREKRKGPSWGRSK